MRKVIPLLILAIAFLLNFTASPVAEMLNPLKAGAPNTVTLTDGNVVYDLNGEWDAVIDNKQYGVSKNVVKITQEGNKFVGVKLIGNQWVGKGSETVKGELEGDGFKSLQGFSRAHGWSASSGKILDGGNKIIEEQPIEGYGYTAVVTYTRK